MSFKVESDITDCEMISSLQLLQHVGGDRKGRNPAGLNMLEQDQAGQASLPSPAWLSDLQSSSCNSCQAHVCVFLVLLFSMSHQACLSV